MVLKARTKERISIKKEEALKEVCEERMVTLTILVPESIRDNLKIKAIRNKTTITNIILDYLKEYIG